MQQIIESMPPELINTLGFETIGSGAGYTHGTFFGLIGFVLLVIATTSWGSAAIAGAEESGHLELALAHGVGRGQYAAESTLSILARLVWLGAIATALILVLNEPAELDLNPGNVIATVAALTGLAFLSGTVALAIGALTGRRSVATVAGAGIAVVGYMLNAIANQVSDVEALRAASPYAWAYQHNPLRDGADWGGLLLLWGAGAVLAGLTVVVLRRRDIVG